MLGIEKHDVNDVIVAGGGPELYVITVWNEGPSDAYDLWVEDFPWEPYFNLDGRDLTPGNQPMSCLGEMCYIPELKAGESVEIYANLWAESDAPLGFFGRAEFLRPSSVSDHETIQRVFEK